MITGNALVVTVVLCNPQMRSTTNLLIINLAIADLLFIGKRIPTPFEVSRIDA
jgi:allatostatin receptor